MAARSNTGPPAALLAVIAFSLVVGLGSALWVYIDATAAQPCMRTSAEPEYLRLHSQFCQRPRGAGGFAFECHDEAGRRHGPSGGPLWPDGHVSEIIEWHHGVRHGREARFFEGGSIQMEGRWEDGERHGTWVQCDPSGAAKTFVYNNGRLEGTRLTIGGREDGVTYVRASRTDSDDEKSMLVNIVSDDPDSCDSGFSVNILFDVARLPVGTLIPLSSKEGHVDHIEVGCFKCLGPEPNIIIDGGWIRFDSADVGHLVARFSADRGNGERIDVVVEAPFEMADTPAEGLIGMRL